MTYSELAVARLSRALVATLSAYLAMPAVLTVAHDEQVYALARMAAHEGRIVLGETR